MSGDRSSSAIVRNPLLALPAAAKIAALPPEAREALREICRELSRDAAGKAEKSWRQRKGPMAAYWRAVAVYARHASLVARAA